MGIREAPEEGLDEVVIPSRAMFGHGFRIPRSVKGEALEWGELVGCVRAGDRPESVRAAPW